MAIARAYAEPCEDSLPPTGLALTLRQHGHDEWVRHPYVTFSAVWYYPWIALALETDVPHSTAIPVTGALFQ
jgi:hypothetical protein